MPARIFDRGDFFPAVHGHARGLDPTLDPTLDEGKITVAMARLDEIRNQLFPAEQARIVKRLVEKVPVFKTAV